MASPTKAVVFNFSQETLCQGPASIFDIVDIIDELVDDCAILVHIMYTCKRLYYSIRPTLYRRFFLGRGLSWVYRYFWPEGFCALDMFTDPIDSRRIELVTHVLTRASVAVPLADLPVVRVITNAMPFMGLKDGFPYFTNCDYDGYLPFVCVAAAYGMNGILQLLLPFGPALEHDNPRVTGAGLEWVAEPNRLVPRGGGRLSALLCAVASDNTLSAALLLQAGAVPCRDAFATAILSHDVVLLRIFSAYGPWLLETAFVHQNLDHFDSLWPADYALAMRQWWIDPEPLEIVRFLTTQFLPNHLTYHISDPYSRTILTRALEQFYPATACLLAKHGSRRDLLYLCSGRFMGYRQHPDRPGTLVWLEEDVVEHCIATLCRQGLMPEPLSTTHVGHPRGPLPPPSPSFPPRRAARLAQIVCRVLRVREPPVMADWQVRAPLSLGPGLCEASRGLHASAGSLPVPYHDLLRHLGLLHAAGVRFDTALILNTYWPSGGSAEGQSEGLPEPNDAGQLSLPTSPCGCFGAVAEGDDVPPSPRIRPPPSRPSFAWSVSMTGCAAFHALHHHSAASASRWAFYVHRPILDWVFFTPKRDRHRAGLRLLPS